MNRSVNLKLPEKGRPNGLFLYCNGCKSYYSTDKDAKCKCRRLVYKARIHVSGTKNNTVPKVLHADNFTDALQRFYEFKEKLVNNSYQTVPIVQPVYTPMRLIECFACYLAFLNNEGVVDHKQKKRDPKYIRAIEHAFGLYQKALESNGINTSILKFTEVNDQMVGYVHRLFLKELDFANKTYNNNMALLSAFTTHIIDDYGFIYKNPFLGVPHLLVNPKVGSIRQSEFEELLEIMSPENGKVYKNRKGRKNKAMDNVFKPWLKHAFKMGLYTGGRSDDIVEPKWTDIILTEDGKFDTIKVVDHKIDRANSHRTSKSERFYKHFSITEELGSLLMEMGYETYRDTDKYIIAPEDKLKRTTIAALIGRAFSHYYKQLNTGKQIHFKDLRKTFMTSALSAFGESSTALTNHKKINMTIKHYQDKEVTRQEAKQSFSVFKKKKN